MLYKIIRILIDFYLTVKSHISFLFKLFIHHNLNNFKDFEKRLASFQSKIF